MTFIDWLLWRSFDMSLIIAVAISVVACWYLAERFSK